MDGKSKSCNVGKTLLLRCSKAGLHHKCVLSCQGEKSMDLVNYLCAFIHIFCGMLQETRGLQARWTAEGLQSDSLSLENGAIMSNASRWSLIIDPQLQGRQWIVSKEAANNLCILQQSQPKYIDQASLLIATSMWPAQSRIRQK